MSKIRRDAAIPALEDRENEAATYPLRLRTELDDVGYEVRFRRGRWTNFHVEPGDEEFGPYPLRTRGTVAWVLQNGRRVAGVELAEYDLELVSDSTIWWAMDGTSANMSRIAEVLLSNWRDVAFEVTGFGQVMEIRSIWVEPGHRRPRIWVPVVQELLRRVKWSVAFALAFPLEYQGKLPAGSPLRGAFRRRQQAMFRYYGQHLGMSRLPGPEGRSGWIWRRRPGLEAMISDPEYDPKALGEL